MMGALDAGTGELVVSTSPTKTSADVIGLLRRLDWCYGPKPGCDRLPVVLVWDNGPVHTSRATRAALAERSWITVEWLPRYAPELNNIESVWTRDR
jgi:transposase